MVPQGPANDFEEENVLSDQQLSDFLRYVCEGCSTSHACALVGLDESNLCYSLNPEHKRYKPALLRLFKRARAVYYKAMLDKVSRAQDSKAAAFWLERHEEEFKQARSDTTVNVGVAISGKPAGLELSPEHLDALSEAYDRLKARREHQPDKGDS